MGTPPLQPFQDETRRNRWPECCYLVGEMRIFFKLFMKLLMMVAMVLLSAGGLKYGTRMMTGSPAGLLGPAGAQVTSEESDLMSTVMESALRLVSGKATRSELANELSDKLYAQRGDAGDMSELGIDLVKAKSGPSPLGIGADQADPKAAAKADPKGNAKADPKSPKPPGAAIAGAPTGATTGTAGAVQAAVPPLGPELVSGKSQAALKTIWLRMKPYTVELCLIPVVFLGMVLVSRIRRRKQDPSFLPEFAAVLPESDVETYVMKHPVQSMEAEDFELLVAMIYQRQGYRVSLPAGLGGGRTGDFKITRKSDRLLVKCQKLDADHRVPIEQVRTVHDAMTETGATGGLYVASCRFTWDARHFAKTRRIKLIDARTLDALLDAAREKPDEDLLAVTQWVAKFMTKAEVTTPLCPECEAEMEKVKAGDGTEWLCSQRPECRGQRAVRKHQKIQRTRAQEAADNAEAASAPQQPASPETRAASDENAGSTPPPATKRQALRLPETPPATPKPSPSPARTEGTGRNANAGATPPPATKRQGIPLPATPKPAPSPARAEGSGNGAGSTPPPVTRRRNFYLPEAQPAMQAPLPTQAKAEGADKTLEAASPPAPAQKRPDVPLPEPRAATPGTARVESAGRSAGASRVPPEFRRRGFILVDQPPPKPKPAPNQAQGGATGRCTDAPKTPPTAPRRRGFKIVEPQPTAPKPAPNPN